MPLNRKQDEKVLDYYGFYFNSTDCNRTCNGCL